MKLNWGTAIVLVFAGFISFIMYFVIHMNTNKKYEHDLVTEAYYKKELDFQKEINAEKNANTLKNKVDIQRTLGGITIAFPPEMKSYKITGVVSLYRPSDKQLDFSIPISLKDGKMILPEEYLIKGKWKISIDWVYENVSYLSKKTIYL